jgi:hypothetical protein
MTILCTLKAIVFSTPTAKPCTLKAIVFSNQQRTQPPPQSQSPPQSLKIPGKPMAQQVQFRQQKK